MGRTSFLFASVTTAILLASGVLLLVSGKSAEAAFPGANGKIAFAGTSPTTGYYTLYTIDPDGTNLTRLTNHPTPMHDGNPTWSPDGRQLVFHMEHSTLPDNPEGDAEIYSINADGSGQTNLTNNDSFDVSPTYSPDGKRIAFTSQRDGHGSKIYVMNADGSDQTELTGTVYPPEYNPAWSPDGTKIAFERGDDIYTIDVDGTNLTRLTESSDWDRDPAWSPDSQQIAFSRSGDAAGEIHVIKADGTAQTNLTNHTTEDANPAWSPDGKQLVFQSYRDGSADIYTMSADGSGLKNLTNADLPNYRPDWQPLPDAMKPTITLTTPTDSATRVSKTTNVTATFSEELKADTLTTSTFKLEKVNRKGSPTPVAATVTSEVVSDPATNKQVTKATLDPTNDLGNGTYRVTITTGATDKAGNALAEDKVWQFKVGK